jgi:hypothetical protein
LFGSAIFSIGQRNGYSRAPFGRTEATMKIELFMVLVMVSGLVGAFVFWLS